MRMMVRVFVQAVESGVRFLTMSRPAVDAWLFVIVLILAGVQI
tara:strand:+ start:473 stop:601 length:129 start_codon:yes stop_codon:yes gene_type:complete